MRSKAKPDARVHALLARYGAADPAHLVARLCSELLDEAGLSVPVKLEVVASYRNARVIVLQQDQAETIVWDGKKFVIRVREEDTLGRQRFSCAHGIVHTFFLETGSRSNDAPLLHGPSEQEEELCDQGAAELLLPRAAFRKVCPPFPDMDDVLEIAAQFEASAEATAIRVVTLSAAPAAMIVLEPRLKPAEMKQISFRRWQSSLPGFATDEPIRPRLRVQKRLCYGLRFIPKHKSVDDSSPLADILIEDAIDYVGETGLVPGRYRVSARRLPTRRGGEVIDRVVALLFDAEAEREHSGMRQLG